MSTTRLGNTEGFWWKYSFSWWPLRSVYPTIVFIVDVNGSSRSVSILFAFTRCPIAVSDRQSMVLKRCWTNSSNQPVGFFNCDDEQKSIPTTVFSSRVTNQINRIFHYLSPHTWFNWFISFVIEVPLGFNPLLHKRTWRRGVESPATEVYYIREKYGYFASKWSLVSSSNQPIAGLIFLASPAIRSSRSEHVKFRVGQVVRHKLYGYRGVIVGWDEIANAPDPWIREHHQGHPVSRSETIIRFLGNEHSSLGIFETTELFCSTGHKRSTSSQDIHTTRTHRSDF